MQRAYSAWNYLSLHFCHYLASAFLWSRAGESNSGRCSLHFYRMHLRSCAWYIYGAVQTRNRSLWIQLRFTLDVGSNLFCRWCFLYFAKG
uniref:Secreted protein n=1 Tax=Ciona intestinalis TaxID=7719 RepID=F7AG55_CIOIN